MQEAEIITAPICILCGHSHRLDVIVKSITIEEFIKNSSTWYSSYLLMKATIAYLPNLLKVSGTRFFLHMIIDPNESEYTSSNHEVTDEFLETINYNHEDVFVGRTTFKKRIYKLLRPGNYLLKKTEPFSLITTFPYEITT